MSKWSTGIWGIGVMMALAGCATMDEPTPRGEHVEPGATDGEGIACVAEPITPTGGVAAMDTNCRSKNGNVLCKCPGKGCWRSELSCGCLD